jgi:uncharacterized protein (DUF488 family)
LSYQLPSDPVRVQLDGRAIWNDGRSIEDADFFTFGYSGRPTEEVLDLLKSAGVATVVDIRFSPVSMYKPDFSKSNLCRIVEAHGLTYLHLPELGVPKAIRVLAAERGTRDVIWEWYDTNIVDEFVGTNLHFFLNIADHPMALMCVEIDPRACHRHRLFEALEDQGLRGFDL